MSALDDRWPVGGVRGGLEVWLGWEEGFGEGIVTGFGVEGSWGGVWGMVVVVVVVG